MCHRYVTQHPRTRSRSSCIWMRDRLDIKPKIYVFLCWTVVETQANSHRHGENMQKTHRERAPPQLGIGNWKCTITLKKDPQGEALDFPVFLHPDPHLCLWTLGSDRKENVVDTSGRNEAPPEEWLGLALVIGWGALGVEHLELKGAN